MLDANRITRKILKTVDGITVTFFHPNDFKKMPVVSYYEITSPTGLCYDNAEQAQSTYMAVDIWAKSAADCGSIAIKVDAAMQKDGWYREFSRDMPPEDGIYHKTMRFHKELYFEEE